VGNVIRGSISIDISDLSRDDGSAGSIDAEQIAGDISRQVIDVDKVVSSLDWLQVLLGDGHGGEVDAVGLVVLSGLDDVSNDDLSIGNSLSLLVLSIGSKDVGSNSVVGVDDSASLNVVNDSLHDSWEGRSHDGDVLRSSDGDDPGSSELAARGDVPVDLVEGGGRDADQVQRGIGIVASQAQSVSIDQRSLGVGSQGSDLVRNVGEVGLGVRELGKRDVSVGVSLSLEVSRSVEDVSDEDLSGIVVGASVDGSIGVVAASGNDEVVVRDGIGRSGQETHGEAREVSKVLHGQSTLNVSSVAGISVKRDDVEGIPVEQVSGRGSLARGSVTGAVLDQLNVADTKLGTAGSGHGLKDIGGTVSGLSGADLGNVTDSGRRSASGGAGQEGAS